MGFYSDHIEPTLVSCACSAGVIKKERSKIVPVAEGRVLEVGFGSGHNIPFYDAAKIDHLYALEPSAGMRRKAAKNLEHIPFSMEWLDLPGEQIPLEDNSVDSVLVTFTLCTIPEVAQALDGMRRVLKPSGKLVFLEHGIAPDAGVRKWQDRLNGVWGKIGGGCNLNRDPKGLVEAAGFEIQQLSAKYLKNTPKFAGYVSAGVAVR